ncbi:VpsP family polysaccharide biosynthesis protein [Agaribacterium sp. ZY112]|uniref:VpsP family polysaccharide biosynthesis protein n=1 Tax=Agaribacterium sp. ZY112 TaxID=3233574 RepID=UPI0035264CDE
MFSQSIHSLLLKLVIATLSLLILFFSFERAFANIFFLKIDAYFSRWNESAQPIPDELEDARAAIVPMLAWQGNNPAYHSAAARVYEWQAYYDFNELQLRQEALREALSYYQGAAKLRPAWPDTWAAKLKIKAQLNEFDDQFARYIKAADKYGPYNLNVNQTIAKTQLLYWDELPKNFRALGLKHITRALANDRLRHPLVLYARSLNRLPIVCSIGQLNELPLVINHKFCVTIN